MKQDQKKIYVVDTSVLIDDPDVFYKLRGDIIVPVAVIREIDGLKRNLDEPKAMAARKVARTLDRIGSYGDLSVGVGPSAGAMVLISSEHAEIDALASEADNRIVGTAVRLKEEGCGKVVLISADINMRNVTRAYGIQAENYPSCIDRPVGRTGYRPSEQRAKGLRT